MKLLLSIAFGFFVLVTRSQITITQTDMPQQGDILEYVNAAIINFDSADTGPAHFWDHSQLTPGNTDKDTAVSVSSTPILYQFFFNNGLFYPDHHADLAFPGQGFSFPQLSVSDVYDYFKVDPDGYRNVGFGANINGLPSSVRRIPVDKVYPLPLNFGSVDSTFSSFEFQVPSLLFFRQDQWRKTAVDGWGTLLLPSGPYDVLRVRSELVRIDSIHIDLLGTGFFTPEPFTVEYKWLAAGEKQPVLQVTTVAGVPTLVRYKDAPITVSVRDPGVLQDHIYWADGSLFLQLGQPAEDPIHMKIFDATGRQVATRGLSGAAQRHRMDFPELSSGLHMVVVTQNEEVVANDRVIVQR